LCVLSSPSAGRRHRVLCRFQLADGMAPTPCHSVSQLESAATMKIAHCERRQANHSPLRWPARSFNGWISAGYAPVLMASSQSCCWWPAQGVMP